MLVHLCTDCGDISINRIAADDDAHSLLEVYRASITLAARLRGQILIDEIEVLLPETLPQVQLQLFGRMAPLRLAETT